jgi:hypothetical protein
MIKGIAARISGRKRTENKTSLFLKTSAHSLRTTVIILSIRELLVAAFAD